MNNNENQKIDETNPQFQKLVYLFVEEFEKIKKKTPIKKVADNLILPNTVSIVKPNLFHKFGVLDLINYINPPEIIEKLQSLLIYTEDKLEISFSLDFAQYGFLAGDLYYKIFEKLFPYYLFWNSQWKSVLLKMLNDWLICFMNEEFPLEITIPLKGFYFEEEKFKTDNNQKEFHYNYDFITQKRDIEISLKSLPTYSILDYGNINYEEPSQFFFKSIKKDITKYCINARGKIPFGINKSVKQTYYHNELWDYIKKVTIAISLEGIPLRFGAPYYYFPWWFSNQIINKFEFFHPDWMSRRYMNPNAYSKLIPDIGEEFDFEETRKIDGILSTFFEIDLQRWINKPLNPIWELRQEFFAEESIKYSNPDLIIKNHNLLNNHKSNFNFWNQSFILNKFIQLSQREKIEDMILDASSILEAIFLGGSDTELSYRLKLNISSLIAGSIEEFKKEYEYFNQFYKLRSAIIHGRDNIRQYKKFLKNCYGLSEEQYDTKDDLLINRLNKTIQYEIFKKIGTILSIILERNINVPQKFKEPGGFLDIFSSKLRD